VEEPSSTCPPTLTTSGEWGGVGAAVLGWGAKAHRTQQQEVRRQHPTWGTVRDLCGSTHPPNHATCHLTRQLARPLTPLAPHHRVRNFLREEMASFLGLCEYTDRSDAARARSYFFDRRKQVGRRWGLRGLHVVCPVGCVA